MPEPAILAAGPCFLCRRIFTFNPLRVPSYNPHDDDHSQPDAKMPLCEVCVEWVNEIRVGRGLEPWPVYGDSYAPTSPDALA